MNYIYDILINYNPMLFDFYEWNKEDSIIHVRKIPVFKVTTKTIFDVTGNRVKTKEFINKIEKKTEIFLKKSIGVLNYGCILTDEKDVIAIKLNKDGVIIGYSKLLIDEEFEVIDYSASIKSIKIDYEIITKRIYQFKTRNEMKIKKTITTEINKIINNKDYEKLEFIYLECFNKKLEINKIEKNIYDEIEENWDNVYMKLYNFFKVTI